MGPRLRLLPAQAGQGPGRRVPRPAARPCCRKGGWWNGRYDRLQTAMQNLNESCQHLAVAAQRGHRRRGRHRRHHAGAPGDVRHVHLHLAQRGRPLLRTRPGSRPAHPRRAEPLRVHRDPLQRRRPPRAEVESTGPGVPFPQHTLEYTVRSGDSWGAPITLHEVLLPAGPPTGHHAPSDTGHRRTDREKSSSTFLAACWSGSRSAVLLAPHPHQIGVTATRAAGTGAAWGASGGRRGSRDRTRAARASKATGVPASRLSVAKPRLSWASAST